MSPALDEATVLRALLEHVPDRIYFKDRQSRFLLINRAQANLFGLNDPCEAIGKTDADFFEDEHSAEALRDEQRVIATGEPVIGIIEEERMPNGFADWVSTTKLPLRDASGNVVGIFGISRDVTDRKQFEQMLEDNNRKLAEIAQFERDALRKLQEAQAKLVQTEKLASLEQLVAGIAHEINNPLSVVSNDNALVNRDLKLLKQSLMNASASDPASTVQAIDEMEAILHRSREGLRRIQRIVLDLRDFACLGYSEYSAVDLNFSVESSVRMVQHRARAKQVTIHLDLKPLPIISCFPAKLNQVVLNLLNNAIDACGQNGEIFVRTSVESTDRRAIKIEVGDNGSGIDPAIQSRIFEPFFTTKPQGEGTGLSLSVSHGIVREHGGEISFRSAVGAGSTFTILLPLPKTSA